MKTTHRDYEERQGDFDRLAGFFSDHNDHLRRYSTWCIGRFVDWNYARYDPRLAFPDFCDQNAHLWFDGFHKLAGFAISENGGKEFAIITLAGYRFLFEEMLCWVLANWSERGPGLSIEITAQQALEAAVLERYGFQNRMSFFRQAIDLARDLPPRTPLPEGFTIVDMATQPDYRAQRVMRDNAFQGQEDVAESRLRWELQFYNYTQHGPIYHAQTDLCVRAPDGRFVAGCEALIDAANVEADIERICTINEFRRRGLARAVIVECLYRLRDMGMCTAYITGYSAPAIGLYRSLAKGEESTFYIFEETLHAA